MKTISTIGLTLTIAILLSGPAMAQLSAGGTPLSFEKKLGAAVPTVEMAPVDVPAMLAQDTIEEEMGLPYRFGYPFDVNLGLDNAGAWEELPDGDRVWRLRVFCRDAFSINLMYNRYYLPEGARLFVYSEDQSHVLGAFTAQNNKDGKLFATAPVKGEVTIVEYHEPAAVRGRGELVISRVVHAYRDIFNYNLMKDAAGFGGSGSCNNNVNCAEGEPWRDEIRSVAMILTGGGFRLCSGSLVNNVRQDETPYFLTANHCLGGESSWIFMFNYQSPSCANIDGPTNQTLQGSTLLANYSTSDFALLRISEAPPESYNVFYSGWSNENTASQASTGIHHPAGDIKKISFDYDPATSTNYLSTSGTTHWRVAQWDDGTTEGGSSGSPLFDQNQRIVGQLHGGYASCYSLTADWYGKFSLSWTGGGSASSRLRDWLDPDNTGATYLDGYDPYSGAAGSIPWADLFDLLTLSGVRWVYNNGVTITTDALNPLSPPYALNLDGGNDTLVSQPIDLSGSGDFFLSLAYQRGGAGDAPSEGNDLSVDYLNDVDEWMPLASFYGAGPAMLTFEPVAFALPTDGRHEAFQLRLTSDGDCEGCDDWFVDNVRLDYPAAMAVAPGDIADSLFNDDSTTHLIIVSNQGSGTLDYTAGHEYGSWLNLDAGIGEIPPGAADTINCHVIAGGLAPGLYQDTIVLTANDPLNSPLLVPVTIVVSPAWLCGDIDGNGEGPDIADLVYLVDFMFAAGPPPEIEAADVDASGGVIDVADVVTLVDFMFGDGEPLSCP